MYSVGMALFCFVIDSLHAKLGSKPTYILGVFCGAIVSLLAITLKYESYSFFIFAASLLRFIDGARETLFEVVAFVYFAENVLEGTTDKM